MSAGRIPAGSSPAPGAGDGDAGTPAPPLPHAGPLVVERLVVRLLEAESAAPAPMAFATLAVRRTCLVEVHAGGHVGIGESWVNHPSWAWAERVATLTEGVFPLLIDTDVSDVREVHGRLIRRLGPLGRQWGAPGPIWQAVSGVDLALWDLLGKTSGRSVGEMLNSSARSRVPVYASGIGPDRVSELTEQVCTQGFSALKVKVGFGEDQDTATLRGVREVAGPDVRVFADANQAWDLDEATRMCGVLETFGVEWCEEPLDGNRVDDLEILHERTGMPLATGENVYGLPAFEAYVDSPAVTLVQPDVAKTGGLTTGVDVAERVTGTDTAVSPHCYSGALTLAASLQLAAALPTVEWVELDVRENPLRTGVTSQAFEIAGGEASVPAGPGLGVTLDEDRVRRMTIRTW